MVIGNGLVAKAFKTYESSDEFLIFASGVSNSKSGLEADYQKEKTLLSDFIRTHPGKTFVYFSTSSVNDPDLTNTRYVIHKLEMEELIKKAAPDYHLFRLSNLAGSSKNKNTVLNFFNYQITHDLSFECWNNAERNIIDLDDAYLLINEILQHKLYGNHTINIANTKNYKVPYIIHCFEVLHGKKAMIEIKEKGLPFSIDVTEILPIARKLNIRFGENYLPELLNKYYS